MAIVELDKITLYGPASQKAAVLDRLQDLGCVHLVNLGDEADSTHGDISTEAHQALRYLKSCSEQRRQVKRKELFDHQRIVSEAIAVERNERDLSDERDLLRKSMNDTRPWGEFQLPDKGRLGDLRFWFYVMPARDAKDLADTVDTDGNHGFVWREVSHDQQNAYVVVLSESEPQAFPGQLATLDTRSLSQLERRLEEVEDQLEEAHHQRVGLTRWTGLLANALDQADDEAARQHAALRTLDRPRVFGLQGWAPREASQHIRDFAGANQLALTIEEPTPGDDPPTLLQNPERIAGGEGLVTFYKTPQYGTWDPSLIAYFSFAVFFAMILADAGYSAVIGLLLARSWKQMGRTQGGSRLRSVLATVVVFSVGYGVICGSYFGFTPPADSWLGKLRILDASSQELMMPLTILIGVIHLSMAHLVMAWLRRSRWSALSSLGWIAAMGGATVGGIGLFGGVAQESASQLTRIGSGLLIGGLVAVFLFSSERPFFSLSPKNHLLRIADGLQGLSGISGLFGDVLSYLRLFALGLSSAKLAETFNSLAKGAWDNAGFGVIAAIAIIILGHTLNLLLGIMSGVVHGLRLNCIEFFKWSLPEEGYLFTAFSKKAKQT